MDITKLVCPSNDSFSPPPSVSQPVLPTFSPAYQPPLRPSTSLESLPCPISSFSSIPIPSVFHQKLNAPAPLAISRYPHFQTQQCTGPLPTPSTLVSLSPAPSPPPISPAVSPPHQQFLHAPLPAAPLAPITQHHQQLSNLRQASNQQQSQTQQPRVECAICGKSFSGISSHNRHVSRTHQKARPFSCSQCGLQFGQKGSLDRHTTAVHLKVKPFSCQLCKKSFGRKDNMKIHMTTVHLKKKPYKCDMCTKSFGGKRPLNIHRQTVHFKQRPLKCNWCDKRFGQKSNLNVHMKVHVREGTIRSTTPTVPTSPIGSVDEPNFGRHESGTTTASTDGLVGRTFAESSGFASNSI